MAFLHDALLHLVACQQAREFADGYETLELAWENCPNVDWKLWLADRLEVRTKIGNVVDSIRDRYPDAEYNMDEFDRMYNEACDLVFPEIRESFYNLNLNLNTTNS